MLYAITPGAPPSTGGNYTISLDSPGFVLLLLILIFFIGLFFYVRAKTSSKRALAGFIEATSIDIAFLSVSVILVVYLYLRYPTGNHLAWAISQDILLGFWLTFAIPIVTVGNSIHHSTRGALEWRGSSIGVSIALFVVFLYLIYFNYLI